MIFRVLNPNSQISLIPWEKISHTKRRAEKKKKKKKKKSETPRTERRLKTDRSKKSSVFKNI